MSLARISRGAGAVGLLAVAALFLHQLRYLVTLGPGAGIEFGRTGHGYLELAIPLVVAFAVAALVVSVVGPAMLRRTSGPGREWGATERAAGYAAALLAVHFTQEIAEGVVAGHGGVVAAALGPGCFVVLPLAIALGAVASFARGWLRGAERQLVAALDRASLPRAPRHSGEPAALVPRRALSSLGLRFGIARRPPPLAHPA